MQVQQITLDQLATHMEQGRLVETTDFGGFQIHRYEGGEGVYLLISNAINDRLCARITP